MKPLIAMITYNRKRETVETLNALAATGALREAELQIWDNGSTDGTAEALLQAVEFGTIRRDQLFLSRENLGCPRALNVILWTCREPGQHFIKVDNDVELLMPGWVGKLVRFLDEHPDVAMASPWYRELETSNQGRMVDLHNGWIEMFPIVGHCCIHRGEFLDQTGYFDVLASDHLYGFEDLLMCHRAGAMGKRCAVVQGIELRNLQRRNSLDVAKQLGAKVEARDEHVERLRPEYNRRIRRIVSARGLYYVGPNGQDDE